MSVFAKLMKPEWFEPPGGAAVRVIVIPLDVSLEQDGRGAKPAYVKMMHRTEYARVRRYLINAVESRERALHKAFGEWVDQYLVGEHKTCLQTIAKHYDGPQADRVKRIASALLAGSPCGLFNSATEPEHKVWTHEDMELVEEPAPKQTTEKKKQRKRIIEDAEELLPKPY